MSDELKQITLATLMCACSSGVNLEPTATLFQTDMNRKDWGIVKEYVIREERGTLFGRCDTLMDLCERDRRRLNNGRRK